MKISLQWLGEYLDGPLDGQAVADALLAGGLPVESIEKVGDDTMLDVEVTSNRGDCLSHIGIARELSALLNRPLKSSLPPALVESTTTASSAVSVRIDAPDLCPHYTARIIRNLKVGPSPQWMQRRLLASGLRPINNIVDTTNYVLFETGQPLHAYDLDKLQGRQIIVRTAKEGEKLLSIDGHERLLKPHMLVIADSSRPLALAGVMGGKDSEVGPATRNILLESARFDPLSVRRTARALAMQSDSSYRFERGIDPTLPPRASLRAAQLILQLAGGELLCGLAEAGSSGDPPKKLDLRLSRLQQVLGIAIPSDQIIDALARQHFDPHLRADRITVTVPSWRQDIALEIDLIEEVARTIGYERIPLRDEISIRLAPPDARLKTIDQIRTLLVAAGYFEAVTFSWVSDVLADDFLSPQAAGLPRAQREVRKVDAQLRPSLLPGLLEALRRNETAGTSAARLFEIGSTFYLESAANIIERKALGIVGGYDLRDVRGAVESLLAKIDPDKSLEVQPGEYPGYTNGACAAIHWGGQLIGHLGSIGRAVAAKLELRQPPCAAELDLEALLSGAASLVTLKPLPRFPAVQRDLSLVVTEATRYQRIQQLISALKPDFLEDLEYVTTYRGKPLEKGQKSVTVTLIFRAPDATLTSEQVEASVQKIIEAAKTQLGATLRT